MSAAPKIIEGTWDEVLKHSSELTGHRVKLIVLDSLQNETSQEGSLSIPTPTDAWVAGLYDWAFNRRQVGPFDDSRDAIYRDVTG